MAVVNDTLVAKGIAQIYLLNDEGAIIWIRKIGSVTGKFLRKFPKNIFYDSYFFLIFS